MSIRILREVPGLKDITMRYEDGGKVQVYKVADREIKFAGSASIDEIIEAFKDNK